MKDFCYLVEGFFDVISLTKMKIDNCLSLLGTSISNDQIVLLRKLNKKIIIFLDGDEAGIRATIDIAISLMLNEIECEIVENLENSDPDDICQLGEEKILSVLKNTILPLDFIVDYYFKRMKVKENPLQVKKFTLQLQKTFSNFKNNIQKFIIEKISEKTNTDKSEIENIYYHREEQKKIKLPTFREKVNYLEERLIYYSCKERSF
jgi:DNA primase